MPPLVNVRVDDMLSSPSSLPLVEDRVLELAESIDRLGLLEPLVGVRHGDRVRLVAGRHRLEAVKRLAWKTVACVVLDLAQVEQQLAEVDENLVRRQLSYLEWAVLISRRVSLLDALGHQRRGRPRKSAPGAGFSPTLTARSSCMSPRSVRLACQIVESLPVAVSNEIRHSKAAESSKQLLALARLPSHEHREAARLLAAGECRRVGEASIQARRNLHEDDVSGDPNFMLSVGDFRNLAVPPGTAALVLTDPPWGRQWVENWNDLAAWTAKLLVPGGVFAAYASIQYLPKSARRSLPTSSTPGQSPVRIQGMRGSLPTTRS